MRWAKMIYHETPDRKTITARARRLLEWLSRRYIDRVQSLAGHRSMHTPQSFVEEQFEAWRDILRRAPAALLEPKATRLLIEEALAEAQLRCADLLQPSLGRERVTQLYRDFARAVDRVQFANVAPKFHDWADAVLPLPEAPSGAVTPDDEALRDRVERMSEEERRSLRELKLSETSTLRDLTPLARLPGLARLHIGDAGMLSDLSPLSRLTDLQELRIDACPKVRGAGPLAPLVALRVLRLERTRISDLTPLRALSSLEELSLQASSDVEDISPLSSLASLRKLDLRHTGVRDLGPLASMEGLRELAVSKCEAIRESSSLGRLAQLQELDASWLSLQSLEGLQHLRRLVSLSLSFCETLTDIRAIGDFPVLEKLDLTGCPIADLTPLETASNLRELSLFGVTVRALPALRALAHLEKLDLRCTDVESLAGIEQARSLRCLEVSSRALRDLTPLATLTELEELDLECDQIGDLEPLRGLTKLRILGVNGGHVRDLSPIANLKALTDVALPRTKVESVEVLGGLPELRHVFLDQCDQLTSLRPLAACPHLINVDAPDCDRLRGPKSLEELRASTTAPAPKRFPSSGSATPARGSALMAFDTRNHLPKRPPERWSVPERTHEQEELYFLEADGVRVGVVLMSRDNDHLLMVYLAPMIDTRATDKQAARILRRFRACDAFVETRDEDALFGFAPAVRCFITRAHAASPETWGAVRQGHAPIRVEPQGVGGEDAAGAAVNVRSHLPVPLPEGWQVRPGKQPEDEHCIVRAPEAEMTLWLRPADASDLLELVVGLFPANDDSLYIGDGAARALLSRLRAAGPFEEHLTSPFVRAPGMRIFVAPAQARSSA